MKTRFVSSSAVLLLLLVSPAYADGLVQSLPDDGAWVRFHANSEAEIPQLRRTGYLIIRSVGRIDEKDGLCRRIEIEYGTTPHGEDVPSSVCQLVVPERHLRHDRDTCAEILRSWSRRPGETATVLKEGPLRNLAVPLLGLATMPRTIAQPRTIEYQRGTLRIERATEGQLEFGAKTIYRRRIWASDDIPFGVAAMTLELVTAVDGQESIPYVEKLILTDFGANAKAAIEPTP